MSAGKHGFAPGDGKDRDEAGRLFKKCIPHDNEWWDEYYYAVLEEEWEASNLE